MLYCGTSYSILHGVGYPLVSFQWFTSPCCNVWNAVVDKIPARFRSSFSLVNHRSLKSMVQSIANSIAQIDCIIKTITDHCNLFLSCQLSIAEIDGTIDCPNRLY